MRSIGELARDSGLTPSALRFYDGAGVLVPAFVDPVTGYRRYADDQLKPARVLASLRRVGMPLADACRVLDALGDPAAVAGILTAHLRRLEDGLADARDELSRVRALLDLEETLMSTITVSSRNLTAALDAVRFAVGADPALPALCGVLVEIGRDALRLVATDRYRLASAVAPGDASGTGTALAPAAFVDEVRALLPADGEATLHLDGDTLAVAAAGRRITATALGHAYPDHRRLLRDAAGDGGHRVTVDAAAVRAAVAAAPAVARDRDGVPFDAVVLAVEAGTVAAVATDAWDAGSGRHVAVNREFLLQALDAGGPGQIVLELDGPIRPLAVRVPDDRRFSILMPVRL